MEEINYKSMQGGTNTPLKPQNPSVIGDLLDQVAWPREYKYARDGYQWGSSNWLPGQISLVEMEGYLQEPVVVTEESQT